jgi:hypothetical protein
MSEPASCGMRIGNMKGSKAWSAWAPSCRNYQCRGGWLWPPSGLVIVVRRVGELPRLAAVHLNDVDVTRAIGQVDLLEHDAPPFSGPVRLDDLGVWGIRQPAPTPLLSRVAPTVSTAPFELDHVTASTDGWPCKSSTGDTTIEPTMPDPSLSVGDRKHLAGAASMVTNSVSDSSGPRTVGVAWVEAD